MSFSLRSLVDLWWLPFELQSRIYFVTQISPGTPSVLVGILMGIRWNLTAPKYNVQEGSSVHENEGTLIYLLGLLMFINIFYRLLTSFFLAVLALPKMFTLHGLQTPLIFQACLAYCGVKSDVLPLSAISSNLQVKWNALLPFNLKLCPLPEEPKWSLYQRCQWLALV